MNKQLAYPNTVKDLVAEYMAKSDALPANLRLIESQIEALNANAVVTVGRTTTLMSNVHIPSPSIAERHLRASAWLAIYKALNLDKVMSAKDKKQFERSRGFAVTGIEYHAGRAAVCRENGFAVQVGNFLDLPPVAEYDAVVMNPPFCHTLWSRHVNHAMKWLKQGGVIIAILPATAEGSDLLPKGGRWADLPIGSFRESGTNVNTGYWVCTK